MGFLEISALAAAVFNTVLAVLVIRADLRSLLHRVYLGFAVSLEGGKGLIVPVLKNAETMNLLGLAKGIADLAAKARNKKLLPEDVQGGTFTITNPGGYGTFHGTPVINQPQVAILGVGAVEICGGLREVVEVILGEAVVEGDVNGVVGRESLEEFFVLA